MISALFHYLCWLTLTQSIFNYNVPLSCISFSLAWSVSGIDATTPTGSCSSDASLVSGFLCLLVHLESNLRSDWWINGRKALSMNYVNILWLKQNLQNKTDFYRGKSLCGYYLTLKYLNSLLFNWQQ